MQTFSVQIGPNVTRLPVTAEMTNSNQELAQKTPALSRFQPRQQFGPTT